jgi:hypothetical protein
VEPFPEWDSVYEGVEPDVTGVHVRSNLLRSVEIERCVDRPELSASLQALHDLLLSSSSR